MKYNKAQLIDALGSFTHDPLGFVYFAFPWGEKGTPLENFDGPDEWQIKILRKIGDELKKGKSLSKAIKIAIASGHGIGKSTLVSFLILFAMAIAGYTCPPVPPPANNTFTSSSPVN